MITAMGFPNIAAVGALVGDPVRAAMISALMDGSERPAGELAYIAGASPQAASAHLTRLVDGGLFAVRRRGRHRYYRLSGEEVAHAIETLSLAAQHNPQRTLRIDPALRLARRCYDHVAGRLGVAICDALFAKGLVIASGDGFDISSTGLEWLGQRAIQKPKIVRRHLVRPCLDWTERRYHVAGWLGAVLCADLEAKGAVQRGKGRTLRVTSSGCSLLHDYFGIRWAGASTAVANEADCC